MPARAVRRGKKNAVGLPGWGESGGKWEDLDRMEEAEKAALEKAQGEQQGLHNCIMGTSEWAFMITMQVHLLVQV